MCLGYFHFSVRWLFMCIIIFKFDQWSLPDRVLIFVESLNFSLHPSNKLIFESNRHLLSKYILMFTLGT